MSPGQFISVFISDRTVRFADLMSWFLRLKFLDVSVGAGCGHTTCKLLDSLGG